MNVSNLRSGDLLYWRGKGFYGWLVRWWTRPNPWKFWQSSPYGHVGMVWVNGGATHIIEANPGRGVTMDAWSILTTPPDYWQPTHTALSQTATQFVIDNYLGRPYSFATAILTVFGLAGRGRSAFMCSELCQTILEICGWKFPTQLHPAGLADQVAKAYGPPERF